MESAKMSLEENERRNQEKRHQVEVGRRKGMLERGGRAGFYISLLAPA
jgi:hypothetical protein